jgi:hypothetical protein
MSIAHLLNKTCTIQRNTPTQDNFGDAIDSWSTISSNVPCRIRKAPSYVVQQSKAGEYLKKGFIVYMHVEPQVHDRLLIDGLYYDVISNNTDSSGDHYELHCELIED